MYHPVRIAITRSDGCFFRVARVTVGEIHADRFGCFVVRKWSHVHKAVAFGATAAPSSSYLDLDLDHEWRDGRSYGDSYDRGRRGDLRNSTLDTIADSVDRTWRDFRD